MMVNRPRLLIVVVAGMVDTVVSEHPEIDVEIVDRRDESEYPVVTYAPREEFRVALDRGTYDRAKAEAMLPPAHPSRLVS